MALAFSTAFGNQEFFSELRSETASFGPWVLPCVALGLFWVPKAVDHLCWRKGGQPTSDRKVGRETENAEIGRVCLWRTSPSQTSVGVTRRFSSVDERMAVLCDTAAQAAEGSNRAGTSLARVERGRGRVEKGDYCWNACFGVWWWWTFGARGFCFSRCRNTIRTIVGTTTPTQ